MAEFRRISLGMFPDVSPVALDIVDLPDDRVLVEGRWRADRDDSRLGALAAVPRFAQIIEFRDDLILRVEYFPSTDEARQAAGVS
jgi:hypothetical protein